MSNEIIEKIKKEYAYEGKSKQWQYGFDSAAKEIEYAIKLERNRLAEILKKAGATLPALEPTGTIEGAMNTGLCIALSIIVDDEA